MLKDTKTTEATYTPVPESVRGLLCALAYGWTPVPMDFARIEQVRYNGLDLSGDTHELQLCENMLVATLRGSCIDGLMPFALDGVLEGRLAGGTEFRADKVVHVGRGFSISKEEGASMSLTIRAMHWILTNGEAPSLWVGPVEGMREINFGGNLIVERRTTGLPRAGHSCHFVLSGAYNYYFIQCRFGKKAGWHLVIDTNGAGVPEREALGRDFLALEFVLGRQLRMPMIFGIASDRRTVACTYGSYRRKHLVDHSFPPVPIERDNDNFVDSSWATVFFERISHAWRSLQSADKGYWIALDMYLDAMQHHLDFDYMRLQIALEAFAFWLLRRKSQGDPMDVKDRDAWEQWVRDNKDAIRAHAVEGRGDALVQKVKGACRLASGNVVPSAFLAHGIKLTKNLREELRGRDVVVHQGLMAPEGYETDRDLRRVALVRTMLVALVARAVGYAGSINGWEIGDMGYPIEQQDWWVVSEEDRLRAHRRFIAEEHSSG